MSKSSARSTTTNTKSTNKFGHYVLAPFRALVRARDMYVNSFSGCAGRVQQGRVVASSVPRSQSQGFYKSRSGEDDIRDLMRAASQGTLGSLNLNSLRAKDPTVVPRSQSVAVGVGIARIDEEQECDFSDEVTYPRSRSVAVVEKRRSVGVLLAD